MNTQSNNQTQHSFNMGQMIFVLCRLNRVEMSTAFILNIPTSTWITHWQTLQTLINRSLPLFGLIFTRWHTGNIFHIFPRKQDLTIHANCLQWRQFAWNVRSGFLGKIRKKSQNVICWNFYQVYCSFPLHSDKYDSLANSADLALTASLWSVWSRSSLLSVYTFRVHVPFFYIPLRKHALESLVFFVVFFWSIAAEITNWKMHTAYLCALKLAGHNTL